MRTTENLRLSRIACVVIIAAFGLTALTLALSRVPGIEHLAPDYVQFWSASNILLERGNPYDSDRQAFYNAQAGWHKDVEGLGRYAFLPYYYPPWLAAVLMPLVPLGFAWAKLAWLAILIGSVLASAWLLRHALPGFTPAAAFMTVAGFGTWCVTLTIGQTAPLIVLLSVLVWRAVQWRSDVLAGMALAWLSIKPQLGGCILAAVLIWAARCGRWRLLAGFTAMTGSLWVASCWFVPGWLAAMLDAPRVTPLVTDACPWMGASWWALLRTLRMSGVPLVASYLAIAVPAVIALGRVTTKRDVPLVRVIGLAALVAFAVVPYLRYYDTPILLLPLVDVLGRLHAPRQRALLASAFMIVPWALWLSIPGEPSLVVGELQWIWMVATLALLWLRFPADQTAHDPQLVETQFSPAAAEVHGSLGSRQLRG